MERAGRIVTVVVMVMGIVAALTARGWLLRVAGGGVTALAVAWYREFRVSSPVPVGGERMRLGAARARVAVVRRLAGRGVRSGLAVLSQLAVISRQGVQDWLRRRRADRATVGLGEAHLTAFLRDEEEAIP